MPENDDCEYCSSSKRLRRHSKPTIEGNNNDNNNNEEDSKFEMKTYEAMPKDMQILLDFPKLTSKKQLERCWNGLDSSINIDVKVGDPNTLHRHPVAQSTDGIRGRHGFETGVHLWKIDWKSSERGTHAVIGICTNEAVLHCHGYCSLIGIDATGWGWDIVRGRLVHDGRDIGVYGEEECMNAEEIFVLLDMDVGTMAFSVGSNYLGIAFCGLNGKILYPAVSAVWGHCEIKMTNIGSLDSRPLSLLQLSRFTIRQQLRSQGCLCYQANINPINNNHSQSNNNMSLNSHQNNSVTPNKNCFHQTPPITNRTFRHNCTCHHDDSDLLHTAYATRCHNCFIPSRSAPARLTPSSSSSSTSSSSCHNSFSNNIDLLTDRVCHLDIPDSLKRFLSSEAYIN